MRLKAAARAIKEERAKEAPKAATALDRVHGPSPTTPASGCIPAIQPGHAPQEKEGECKEEGGMGIRAPTKRFTVQFGALDAGNPSCKSKTRHPEAY